MKRIWFRTQAWRDSEEMRRRALDAERFPINATLTAARRHCEEVHGAPFGDFNDRTASWHNRNAPDCPYRIPFDGKGKS